MFYYILNWIPNRYLFKYYLWNNLINKNIEIIIKKIEQNLRLFQMCGLKYKEK